MEPVRVVVHLKDGKIGKGYANDFNPTRNSFHFYEETGGSQKQSVLLEMKDLKALFFVKTFEGNRNYRERKNFAKDDLVQGRSVEVTFSDGEVIQGSTVGYDPQRLGFFLIPIDSNSNNIRIFVITSAVKKFRFL
jgi:hypothetical protein